MEAGGVLDLTFIWFCHSTEGPIAVLGVAEEVVWRCNVSSAHQTCFGFFLSLLSGRGCHKPKLYVIFLPISGPRNFSLQRKLIQLATEHWIFQGPCSFIPACHKPRHSVTQTCSSLCMCWLLYTSKYFYFYFFNLRTHAQLMLLGKKRQT